MPMSKSRGWTDKDIDLEDPEAYHGGGIVTIEIKGQQLEKERKKKKKKRIEEQRQMLAQLKANRKPMQTF